MGYEFYPSGLVEKARKLKTKGFSIYKIGKELGIDSRNISRWCRDIPSKNPYSRHIKNLQLKNKSEHVEILKELEVDTKTAKVFSSMLYWCEGFKYPSSNFVGFSNSDLGLIKTFIELFRIGFNPIEDKFRAHLQLHTTHDKEEVVSFWSDFLKIPKEHFFKPTITKPTNKMKRQNYIGTCTVRYYDVNILHQITGIFEEFSKRFNTANIHQLER